MEEYGDMLLRTATLLLKDHQAAEEAVQDTFVQAYEKIAQLKEPEKLRNWLVRIVVNRCRARQRSWSWRRILPSTLPEEHRVPDLRSGPEQQSVERSESRRLMGEIHRLKFIYREVIMLYYYQDWSIQEISHALGCSENTVKSRLARGRSKLKDLLEEGGMPDGERAGTGTNQTMS
ncbi:RNA polymerase [Paenibacillus sp. CAA11]|nr:RNA polymerase [Paenibacillus sp. CAA11]